MGAKRWVRVGCLAGAFALLASESVSGAGLERGPYLLKDVVTTPGQTYFGVSFPEEAPRRVAFWSVPPEEYWEGWGDPVELWLSDGTPGGTVALGEIGIQAQGGLVPLGRSLPVALGDHVYWSRGEDLWASDGSDGGAAVVLSLPGTIARLSAAVGKLFFEVNGLVWTSDGTAAGTAPWPAGVPVPVLEAWGLFVFVSTRDGLLGVTDGTQEGTVSLWAYLGRAGRGQPTPAFLDGLLYFAASDGVHGVEPWVSDGTPTGTWLVKDLNPGPGSSDLGELTVLGGRVYFSAYDGTPDASGVYGPQLWVTDGTGPGTRRIGSECFPDLAHIAAYGDRLYLIPQTGRGELWTSDGTDEGTVPIRVYFPQIAGGSEESIVCPVGFANGRTIVVADYGTFGREVWAVDTLTGSSELLRREASRSNGQSLSGLQPIEAPFGTVLWSPSEGGPLVVDWDAERTTSFRGLAGLPDDWTPGGGGWDRPIVIGSLLLFAGSTGLLATDGTPEGTVVLHDDPPCGLAAAVDRAFFISGTGCLGVTDGSLPGTRLLSGVLVSRTLEGASMLGDRLFFRGGDTVWTSDGTPQGTGPAHELMGRPETWSLWDYPVHCVGQYFIVASDDVHGAELWATDYTPQGTRLVKDIRPGAASSGVGYLASIEDRVLFLADDGTHGAELWASDGVTEGTRLVKDIRSGGASADLRYLGSLGDRMLLVADDGAHGGEPWVSDGTAEGTRLLRDIQPGPLGSISNDGPFLATSEVVVFGAQDGVRNEPWASDGTESGTLPLRDLLGLPNLSHVSFPSRVGDLWVFEADGELWASDGTSDGTRPLPDGEATRQILERWEYLLPKVGTHVFEFEETGAFTYSPQRLLAADFLSGETLTLREWGPAVCIINFDGQRPPSCGRLWSSGSTVLAQVNDAHGGELWALPHADRYDPGIVADFTAAQIAGGDHVFDATGSTGRDGVPIASFGWKIDDGTVAERGDGPVIRRGLRPGRHRIALEVTDVDDWLSTARQLVTVACPAGETAPWQAVDIGRNPLGFPGAASLVEDRAESRLTVCAGGRRIDAQRDGYHFVHQRAEGDLTVTARIQEFSGHEGARIGLMVREGLTASSRHIAVLVEMPRAEETPRLRIVARTIDGGETEDWTEVPLDDRTWLRLAREGDSLFAYASGGASWGAPLAQVGIAGLGDAAHYGVVASCGDETLPDEPFEALLATVVGLRLGDGSSPQTFVRADANADRKMDLSDPVATLGYLFLGAQDLACLDAADADDSGAIEITDAIYSLRYLFTGGPPPPAPLRECGLDPTDDEYGCVGFAGCP